MGQTMDPQSRPHDCYKGNGPAKVQDELPGEPRRSRKVWGAILVENLKTTDPTNSGQYLVHSICSRVRGPQSCHRPCVPATVSESSLLKGTCRQSGEMFVRDKMALGIGLRG